MITPISQDNEPLLVGRNYLQDFFGIDDKKLSRGQIQARIGKDGQLMMKSKGVNPSMLNNQPMGEDKEFKIQNADVIYLIPAFYGFRVIKGEIVKHEQNNNNNNNAQHNNNNNQPIKVDDKPIEQKQNKRVLADESDDEVQIIREIKSPQKNSPPPKNYLIEKNEGVDELIADVNKLKEVCDRVGFYLDDESGYWVVRMPLDTSFLAKQNAKNWGITPNKPIIIQLKFTSDYLDAEERPDSPAPYTLFVFQSGDQNQPQLKDYETEFGVVQWFIETRVQNLLRKNWNNKPAKYKERSKKLAESKDNMKNRNILDNDGKTDDGLIPGELEELIWMGFSRQQALQALKDAKGDLQQAVGILLSDPMSNDMEVVKKDNKNLKKEEKSNLVQDPNESPIETLKRFGFSDKECVEALQQTEGDVESAANWLLEKGNKEDEKKSGNNKKKSPSKKGGKKGTKKKTDEEEDEEISDTLKEEEDLWKNGNFLGNLYQYIHLRFITCPSHCLICDKNLDVAMLKFPVCSKVQCVKVYETTSMGTCANEIKNNPIVVDLLLNLLCAAATSTNPRGWNRHGLGLQKGKGVNPYVNANQHKGKFSEFEPFPYGLGFDSKKEQDGSLLLETINMIPALSVLQQYSTDEQLKIVLDEISVLCFPLLRWVIQSCRVHLSPIPESKRLNEMKTPYQFQMVSSYPEHEKQFIAHKEKALTKNGCISDTGSFFAFHGSHVSNWHSIVRTGLRSGFVPGIYMAQLANTSLGYMGVGQHSCQAWSNSMMNPSKSMGCISLIEVADHRKTTAITGPTDKSAINVARNPTMVVTRFLFFYPNGPKWNHNIYASSLKIHDFLFLEDNKRRNDDSEDDTKKTPKKYRK